MPEIPTAPSPELEAFGRQLAGLIREAGRVENERLLHHLQEHIDDKFGAFSEMVDRKIERLRKEITERQDTQSLTLREHGEAIARMEERLKNGEIRFKQHDARLAKVETGGNDNRAKLAVLASSLAEKVIPSAIGAGVTLYIYKILGGT